MIPIRDTAPCYSKPYVTWALIAICTIIFIILELLDESSSNLLVNRFGMVPIRYAHGWASYNGMPFDGYFSVVSCLFLHASWAHLLMNMWFLWIFADNVEDRMGHGRFIAFYLICGIFSSLLQWYFDTRLAIPVVGASGAIAGVLGAYFFLYPLERVVIWVPLFFLPLLFHVPAIAFLGIWILIQLHNATTALVFDNVTVDVAWWAHMGGFIAGMLLHRFFLKPNHLQAN